MSREISNSEQKNIRTGYQVAVDLYAHVGDEVWARYNAMLVAHAIFIAIIVNSTIKNNINAPIITIPLSIVGAVICFFWLLTTKRCVNYQDYFLNSARELEENYLSDSIKTVSRGAKFAEGKKVHIKLKKSKTFSRMCFWSRMMKANNAACSVIALFFAIYVFFVSYIIYYQRDWFFIYCIILIATFVAFACYWLHHRFTDQQITLEDLREDLKKVKEGVRD